MLETLVIENVAIIDKAILNFENGLNTISGETGAGKSILLDSLSFVFGGRADKSLIRSNAKSMKVEAIFISLNDKIVNIIKNELNIDCNDELFLSRELDQSGKNTCKINGELVPVATVKKVCQMLVDVHGQSEHLAILNNDYQLRIIDLYSKDASGLLLELEKEISKYKDIDDQIKELGGNEREKQNLIDLYSYQIKEIEDANIEEFEYDDLSNEKRIMQQYEKINDNLKTCISESSQNGFETVIVDKIANCVKALSNIQDLDPHYRDLMDRFNSVRIEIEDLNDTIIDDIEKNVFDEERFNYIDNRLDLIKSLYRKYGGDFSKLNNYYSEIKNKLDNLLNSAEKYNELIKNQQNLLENINNIQNRLSKLRKNSAKELISRLEIELKNLGMPNARLDIEFSRINEEFSLTGYDRVEFMFSSNLGFELKALNKVVSGGEMSRVMLAYKIVVSEIDDIQTIVFDEVDSGLSGNIAVVVAEYMARLSRIKQILAVSHLPQICAMADYNIKVEKYSDQSTTHTKATVLEGDELYCEISRLMGANLDSVGLMASKELKEKMDQYKNSIK